MIPNGWDLANTKILDHCGNVKEMSLHAFPKPLLVGVESLQWPTYFRPGYPKLLVVGYFFLYDIRHIAVK